MLESSDNIEPKMLVDGDWLHVEVKQDLWVMFRRKGDLIAKTDLQDLDFELKRIDYLRGDNDA